MLTNQHTDCAYNEEEANSKLAALSSAGQHIIYSEPIAVDTVTEEAWIIALFKEKKY